MVGKAGKDANRLAGYTWHSNRHTFASRLVMAGINLRAVHLAPEFLREAVERLVGTRGVAPCRLVSAV